MRRRACSSLPPHALPPQLWPPVSSTRPPNAAPPVARPSLVLQRAGAVRACPQVRALHPHRGLWRAGNPVRRQDRPLPQVRAQSRGVWGRPRGARRGAPGIAHVAAARRRRHASHAVGAAQACVHRGSAAQLTPVAMQPPPFSPPSRPLILAGTSAWCASPTARPTSGGAPARPTTKWTSGE